MQGMLTQTQFQMADNKEAELGRCPDIAAELLARAKTKEKFMTPLNRPLESFGERYPVQPPETPWPNDPDIHLKSDNIPMDPLKWVPKAAFLAKKRAAVYIMAAARTKEVFQLTSKDINVIRELMARCPILKTNLAKPLSVWEWTERTSGLYIRPGKDKTTQLSMVRPILTTLIWKIKEAVRETSVAHGAIEPLLDIGHLQMSGIDLAYDPTWDKRGEKSFEEDKIDTAAAEKYAKDLKTGSSDPYNMAGKCPGCDANVPPGQLHNHSKQCLTTSPTGHRIKCPRCDKELTSLKHLAQHRAIHCRGENDTCDACKTSDCTCKELRKAVCNAIQELVRDATDKGTNTIFDLANTDGRTITDKEIKMLSSQPGTDMQIMWDKDEPLEKTVEAMGLVPRTMPTITLPPPCLTCNKTFTTQEEADDHTCRQQVKCPLCNFKCTILDDLGEHISHQHYPCNYCNYVAETAAELQGHTMDCTDLDQGSDDNHTDTDDESGSETQSKEDDKDKMEVFTCTRCPETFTTVVDLISHTNTSHRSEGEDPLWCPECEKGVLETRYTKHLKRHPAMWAWCPGGVPCPQCPERHNTIAHALEHILNFHKTSMSSTLMTIRMIKSETAAKYGSKGTIVALRKMAGEEGLQSCKFEGCGQEFFDKSELTAHQSKHRCSLCEYVGISNRDLADHKEKHGRATKEGSRTDNFTCEKCGMKLSSLKELTEHKDNHKKFACGKCHTRFTSNFLANKHESTCTSTAMNDVFEASRSSDPLMVALNSLGQVANTLGASGALDNRVTDLLKDQLNKAKHNHATRQTEKKNHGIQRTYTFLKPPIFTPGNTNTSYSTKDTQSLTGKEFSGRGSPEDNFTRLQLLTSEIARIVKSRLITRDVASELLLQHLKSPALELTATYREDFEQKHGEGTVPEYEDILIFLESTYINIKPHHAREQLNALKKSDSESIQELFLRAWRCSHFASFTVPEPERYKFRQDTVKEVMMRNLGPAKRKTVDEEELERKVRGDDPLSPREMVELLSRHQQQKEALDMTRSRPDYSLIGDLSAAHIKRVEKFGPTNRGKTRGQPARGGRGVRNVTTPKNNVRDKKRDFPERKDPPNQKGIRESHIRTIGKQQHSQTQKDEKAKWILEAKRITGEGCFKCGKTGHGSKQCRKYRVLTKTICPKCKTGFHMGVACALNKPNTQGRNVTNSSTKTNPSSQQQDRTRYSFQQPNHRPDARAYQQPRKENGYTFRGQRQRRGVSRLSMDQYRSALTWKARQVSGNQDKVKTEPNQNGNNKGAKKPPYNPFLTSGQRIGRVQVEDPTSSYMDALEQANRA